MLKKINPEYPLEGIMLKLQLQYFGHLIRRANSLGKTLMLEKIEGRRWRGWQRMRWLHSVTDSMDINLSKLQEIVKNGEAWSATVPGVIKSWTWLNDWTATATIHTLIDFEIMEFLILVIVSSQEKMSSHSLSSFMPLSTFCHFIHRLCIFHARFIPRYFECLQLRNYNLSKSYTSRFKKDLTLQHLVSISC